MKKKKDSSVIKINKEVLFWSFIIILLLIGAIYVVQRNSMYKNTTQNQAKNYTQNKQNNEANNVYQIQKTPEQQCQESGGNWCNNECYSACSSGQNFICSVYGKSGCINQTSQLNYSFTTYTDTAPYYGAYCDKIDSYNLDVRKAASEAIRNDPGIYNINQLLDIYDWVKKNITYQTVTSQNVPYPPSQTLATQSGDCKNQAVLIASMVEAIGGTAKVVADPSCNHAYTLVYISNSSQDMQSIVNTIDQHYNQKLNIQWITLGMKNWLIFDPAGGYYPGNTLPECSGKRTVYYVNTCMSCAQQYSTEPYTFNGRCYSQCPSGTISVNNNACSSCPNGEYSYNNECVTCPSGTSLHTDGRCYPN